MPVTGVPPMFLTAALLLCVDPVTSEHSAAPLASMLQDDLRESGAPLSSVHAGEHFEVIASSPLPAGNDIGSRYGFRTSTRTGTRTFHAGVDFLTERGTPVYAVARGVVETVTRNTRGHRRFAGYGNAVVVHHPELGRWTFYAHLESVDVEEGQVLAPGEPIGAVGNTTNGRFRGMVPHLHLEVREARGDGGSPFPGPYRRHNLDPAEWLAELGVRFNLQEEDGDDCVHFHGEPDEDAPILTVRDHRSEPMTLASSSLGVAAF